MPERFDGELAFGAVVVESGARVYLVLLDGRRVGLVRRERLAFSAPGRGWAWTAAAPWLRFASWRSLRGARRAVVRGFEAAG